jgi:hypothetical protein
VDVRGRRRGHGAGARAGRRRAANRAGLAVAALSGRGHHGRGLRRLHDRSSLRPGGRRRRGRAPRAAHGDAARHRRLRRAPHRVRLDRRRAAGRRARPRARARARRAAGIRAARSGD